MPENIIVNNEYIDGSSRIEINENGETTPVNPITTAQSVQVKIGTTDTDLKTIINNDIYVHYNNESKNHNQSTPELFKKLKENNVSDYNDGVYGPVQMFSAVEDILSDNQKKMNELSNIVKNVKTQEETGNKYDGAEYFKMIKMNYAPIHTGGEYYSTTNGYENIPLMTDLYVDIFFYPYKKFYDEFKTFNPIKVTLYNHPFSLQYIYNSSDPDNISTGTSDYDGDYIRIRLVLDTSHIAAGGPNCYRTFPMKTKEGKNVMGIRSEALVGYNDPILYRPYIPGYYESTMSKKCMFNDKYYPIIMELNDEKIIYCNTIKRDPVINNGIGNIGYNGYKKYYDINNITIVSPTFILIFDYIIDNEVVVNKLRKWYNDILDNSDNDNYGMSLDDYTEFFEILGRVYGPYDSYKYTQNCGVVLSTNTYNQTKTMVCKPKLYAPINVGIEKIYVEWNGVKSLVFDSKHDYEKSKIQTPIGEFYEYNIFDDYIYIDENTRITDLDVIIKLQEGGSNNAGIDRLHSEYDKLTRSHIPLFKGHEEET